MNFVRNYVRHRSQVDPEFERAWDNGSLDRDMAKQLIGMRLTLGMTPTQFAERVGVTPQALAQWERGERNLTPDLLHQLAQRAGIPLPIRPDAPAPF